MTRPTQHKTLISSLDQFTLELGKSPLPIQAYRTDIQQFLTWLNANDLTVIGAHRVTRSHINEYLSYLANQGRTGTTRARKLVSLHLFFTYLVHEGVIPDSPTAKVKRPRREHKPKHVLRPDEYRRMLGAARGSPRDYALFQLLLQTGIRVSELIAIRVPELDLEHKTLTGSQATLCFCTCSTGQGRSRGMCVVEHVLQTPSIRELVEGMRSIIRESRYWLFWRRKNATSGADGKAETASIRKLRGSLLDTRTAWFLVLAWMSSLGSYQRPC